jgi:hypothetical protein
MIFHFRPKRRRVRSKTRPTAETSSDDHRKGCGRQSAHASGSRQTTYGQKRVGPGFNFIKPFFRYFHPAAVVADSNLQTV